MDFLEKQLRIHGEDVREEATYCVQASTTFKFVLQVLEQMTPWMAMHHNSTLGKSADHPRILSVYTGIILVHTIIRMYMYIIKTESNRLMTFS